MVASEPLATIWPLSLIAVVPRRGEQLLDHLRDLFDVAGSGTNEDGSIPRLASLHNHAASSRSSPNYSIMILPLAGPPLVISGALGFFYAVLLQK